METEPVYPISRRVMILLCAGTPTSLRTALFDNVMARFRMKYAVRKSSFGLKGVAPSLGMEASIEVWDSMS